VPQSKDPARPRRDRPAARTLAALPPRLDLKETAPEPDRPTAIAVALKQEKDAVPTVVASGRGHLAEQILAVAFAAGVRVREDADLAELLAAAGVDLPIPPASFEAVAEIMTYLYRANSAAPAGAAR
jgi:flagellar biosynthesis protein